MIAWLSGGGAYVASLAFELNVSHRSLLDLFVVLNDLAHFDPFPKVIIWIILALTAFFWLWIYGLAIVALRFCQSFDIGFGWIRSKADIENHPLKTIGLIAAALVGISYWSMALISRVL